MVEVDFSGNFTSSDNCPENDIGVFLNEGKFVDKGTGNKTWKQFTIDIEVNSKHLTHGMRNSEGKRFQDAYGKDTKTWIGKKFKITHIPYVKQDRSIGKNVELIPLIEKV